MKLDASHKKRILRVATLLVVAFVAWRASSVVPRTVTFEVHSEDWGSYQTLELDIFHEGAAYKLKQWAFHGRTSPPFFLREGAGINSVQVSLSPGVYQVWLRVKGMAISSEIETTLHVPEQSVISFKLDSSLEELL